MADISSFKACGPQRIVSNLLTVNTESVDCVRGLNSSIFKYSLWNSRSDFITFYALDFIFLVETWSDVDIQRGMFSELSVSEQAEVDWSGAETIITCINYLIELTIV